MSKRSLFFGNATGKLGEIVLYRAGGEQRARAYVPKIKNPKTIAQMENRILMNNVVSMFRTLKPILSVSFPMRPTKQSGFNAFVKANKNVNGYAISKEELEIGAAIPVGMVISKGDIPFDTSLRQDTYRVRPDEDPYYTYKPSGLVPSGATFINADDDVNEGFALTSKQIYQLMTSNGNPFNLPSEFKLTIVSARYGTKDDSGEGEEAFWPVAHQYICNAVDDNNVIKYGNSEAGTLHVLRAINIGEKTQNADGTYSIEVGNIVFGSTVTEADLGQQAVGFIISWTENGKLRVTSSRIYSNAYGQRLVKDWQKGGFVYEQVLQQYGYTQGSALSTSIPQVQVEEEVTPEEPAPDDEQPAD